MKTIESIRDMSEYGIEILTGEACAYGRRILCDVSDDGALLIASVLGLPEIKLSEAWNSGTVNGKVKVGSVMIPYEWAEDLKVFALFDEGARTVVICGGDVTGLFDEDFAPEPNPFWDRRPEATKASDFIEGQRAAPGCTNFRTITPIGGPRQGDRMAHAMSGRTA